MFSLLNFISSSQRLKESHKTISMMCGPEECNSMVLAQHEMIELEVNYYRGESKKSGVIFVVLMFIAVGVLLYLDVL